MWLKSRAAAGAGDTLPVSLPCTSRPVVLFEPRPPVKQLVAFVGVTTPRSRVTALEGTVSEKHGAMKGLV